MPVYTLSGLRTLVYSRVEGNNILYVAAELNAVINECLRLSNAMTGFYSTSIVVSGGSVADQLVYAVPTGILFPTQISFNARVLDKIGLTAIGESIRSWATDTTSTYGPVARWVPIGITKFAIHPIDATGGSAITVQGVAETTQLSADGDAMELDDEFVAMLVDYCGHRLTFKEAGKIFADSSVLIQTYWREMKRLKKWQLWKAPRYFVQVEQPK